MDIQSRTMPWSHRDVMLGAGVYNRLILSIYDPLVVWFENSFVWRCPSREILAFYNRHISGDHLEVGVGTGYFLDKCQFPVAAPHISLLDINPNALRFTARRIRRYRPVVYLANVLEPISHPLPFFDTIGMNFLLHCLPGALADKGDVVFRHLKVFLKPEGLLFGSTILGQGVEFDALGKWFMGVYNSYLIPGARVLYNQDDRLEDLESSLARHFERYSVHMRDTVAFFTAGGPKV